MSNVNPFIVVLGIAQDAGFPQAGCKLKCCQNVWRHPRQTRFVTSLAIVDPSTNQRWLIDATPDLKHQLHLLDQLTLSIKPRNILDGIFLTHGHIGHYIGLIHCGKEAMNTRSIPTFVMPKMKTFLNRNEPWKQLITNQNITLKTLVNNSKVILSNHLSITPFLVPHRNELTETIRFFISGPSKRVVFIPDIDHWKIFPSLQNIINSTDTAFIDGTFFDQSELPNRDISKIPHPSISHTLNHLQSLSQKDKSKVNFIHLNHTNPVLTRNSLAHQRVRDQGFNIAKQNQIIPL
ncbi:MAG: MBL fold metallo-hydrolase [bacterium]